MQRLKSFIQEHRNLSIAIVAVLGIAVIGCCLIGIFAGGGEEAAPEETIQTVQETRDLSQPTDTTVPTTETEPTEPPEPTNTPEPTDTPTPTNTPGPTDTAEPTATPTPAPELQTYSGTGDAVVDVEEHVGPAIVHITGNASARHFAVKNYDPGNEQIDLLVNTTDPYDGYRPLDWASGEETRRFQITAPGQWTIEIIPLAPIPEFRAHGLDVPGTYEGNGDDVIMLVGDTPDLANIGGNRDARHFAVKGYANRVDLLVNTTDPYEGTVMLDPETFALEVVAHGSWSVEVTSSD